MLSYTRFTIGMPPLCSPLSSRRGIESKCECERKVKATSNNNSNNNNKKDEILPVEVNHFFDSHFQCVSSQAESK